MLSATEFSPDASRDVSALEHVDCGRALDDQLQFGLQGPTIPRSPHFQPLDGTFIEISDQHPSPVTSLSPSLSPRANVPPILLLMTACLPVNAVCLREFGQQIVDFRRIGLELHAEIALYAPDMIAAEFGNILWKKVRREEIGRAEAGEIMNAFARLPFEIRPSSTLLPAVELDRTVYDSLYLALAVAEDCALITADARFHAAIATSSLAEHVQWVEDEI